MFLVKSGFSFPSHFCVKIPPGAGNGDESSSGACERRCRPCGVSLPAAYFISVLWRRHRLLLGSRAPTIKSLSSCDDARSHHGDTLSRELLLEM